MPSPPRPIRPCPSLLSLNSLSRTSLDESSPSPGMRGGCLEIGTQDLEPDSLPKAQFC